MIALFVIVILLPNRVVIRNDGGAALQNVQLTLRDPRGRLIRCKSVQNLSPGESISFRHSENDPRADLRFSLAGQMHSYEGAFDLWQGEGWVLAVDSSGSISSGYEGVEQSGTPH